MAAIANLSPLLAPVSIVIDCDGTIFPSVSASLERLEQVRYLSAASCITWRTKMSAISSGLGCCADELAGRVQVLQVAWIFQQVEPEGDMSRAYITRCDGMYHSDTLRIA